MLELLFVIGFFVMLLVTGVSLLGIIAASRGGGVDYSGAEIPERKRFSRQ